MNDARSLRAYRFAIGLIVIVYAAGLARDVREPWIGMHDWNGAFYSQLARNFLRYPYSIHHGMPIVAVGATIPPPEERSFYPRHPPALVWLVAGAFRIFGESEGVARSVPIACSLGSLTTLVGIVRRARDRRTAITVGAIYSVLPMTVYYGRMVNHEAVCLFFMLLAIASWQQLGGRRVSTVLSGIYISFWSAALLLAVWTDWPGILFGAVFVAWAALQWKKKRISPAQFACAATCVLISTTSVLIYLSYVGFNGRWADMISMFQSRRESVPDKGFWEPFHHAKLGLSWPVLALCAANMVMGVSRIRSHAPKHSSVVSPDIDSPANALQRSCQRHGLEVITATGVVWALVFWRQFQIHEYWMFYLAPCFAIASGNSLIKLYQSNIGKRIYLGRLLSSLFAIVAAMCCFQEVNEIFSQTDWGRQDVEMCRDMASQTKPDERVVLTWNPCHVEQHGQFTFRNIVPPQFCYYLDRAFDVVTDTVEIQRRKEAGDFVVILRE